MDKRLLYKSLKKIPFINNIIYENELFRKNSCYQPGHFYSPIISVDEIKARENIIWSDTKPLLHAIDLNTEEQSTLIKSFEKYYNEIPFAENKNEGMRFYFNNGFYSYSDAVILYSMIRHYSPARIIEIGSGFSSALMLDTNEIFFHGKIQLTFIEPNTERIESLISDNDKTNVNLIKDKLQNVNLDLFNELQPSDFLFIDSSHVVKTGSDVNMIIYEILPRLKKGVYIHFHDISNNFEYPKEWVFGGRNWNENYFLHAFLMYNNSFKIKLFSAYMHHYYADIYKSIPLVYKNTGGCLWLEKVILIVDKQQNEIIFDASVLIAGHLSGDIYKTGIYRVTYQILNELTKRNEYFIYLYDIYNRERELRKYVLPHFENIHVLPMDSRVYKSLIYPLFNLADFFRLKENQSDIPSLKFVWRIFKNLLQTTGKIFHYIEQKRDIPYDHLNLKNSDIYFSTYNKFPTNVSFLKQLKKGNHYT